MWQQNVIFESMITSNERRISKMGISRNSEIVSSNLVKERRRRLTYATFCKLQCYFQIRKPQNETHPSTLDETEF